MAIHKHGRSIEKLNISTAQDILMNDMSPISSGDGDGLCMVETCRQHYKLFLELVSDELSLMNGSLINDRVLVDVLDAENEEPFTLDPMIDLIFNCTSQAKDFIIARVKTVDPHDPERFYYSYYDAYHINKVLFRTQPELGLLHRMRARNPLNNMEIVGDVHYYTIKSTQVHALMAELSSTGKHTIHSSSEWHKHVGVFEQVTAPVKNLIHAFENNMKRVANIRQPKSASHDVGRHVGLALSVPSSPLNGYVLDDLATLKSSKQSWTENHWVSPKSAAPSGKSHGTPAGTLNKHGRKATSPRTVSPTLHSFRNESSGQDVSKREMHTWIQLQSERLDSIHSDRVRNATLSEPKAARVSSVGQRRSSPVKSATIVTIPSPSTHSYDLRSTRSHKMTVQVTPSTTTASGRKKAFLIAEYYGTDDDFLTKTPVRTYFKTNALNPDDAILFTLNTPPTNTHDQIVDWPVNDWRRNSTLFQYLYSLQRSQYFDMFLSAYIFIAVVAVHIIGKLHIPFPVLIYSHSFLMHSHSSVHSCLESPEMKLVVATLMLFGFCAGYILIH